MASSNRGSCYLQVLGTGNCELSPSVFLFTDMHRYLFNCGESVQRFCFEHKVRLSRIRNVFVTRCSWENVGGVPGLAMSLRDVGVQSVRLHGPATLTNFQRAAGVFMRRENVTLETSLSGKPYKDECITVQSVCLSQAEQEGTRSGSPSAKRFKPHPQQDVIAYACKLPPTPGKFNPAQAKLLGLPPSPLYAELVRGKSVTTPEGKVIHPQDVLGPEQKGPAFIIIECPHTGFINSVLTAPQLQYPSVKPDIIVHMCPHAVMDDPKYQQWLLTFDPSTKHLLIHPDFSPPETTMRSILKIQLPLHLLDSRFFLLPPLTTTNGGVLPQTANGSPLQFIAGQSLLKYHLRPASKAGQLENESLKSISEDVRGRLDDILFDEDLSIKLGLNKSATKKQAGSSQGSDIITQLLVPSSVPREAALTFLGTGAAMSSKYRNVSGILIHTGNGRHILLDCGEGTLAQFYTCFGKKQAEDILRSLTTIFVSHIHGDHHLGLIRIIQQRRKLLMQEQQQQSSNELLVIGPWFLLKWIGDYSLFCEKTIYDFCNSKEFSSHPFRRSPSPNPQRPPPLTALDIPPPTLADTPPAAVLTDTPTLLPQQLAEAGMVRVTTVPVKHCAQSYGIVLDHKDGWRLVYSGDTRPCPELVAAGNGTTVLIHEATFEHDLLDEAISRKHSTTTEALEVANKMEAQFTILTHFSQRYPKVSPTVTQHCTKRVGVAFDGMTVKLRELHCLPELLPTIQDIFTSVVDEQEQKEESKVELPMWS